MGVTYERVILPVKLTAGADKASMVRGGDISDISLVKSHYCVTTVRDMKYTTQHCCDKAADGKMMALKSRMLFSELYQIMVNKVIFVGFRGSDRPNFLFW